MVKRFLLTREYHKGTRRVKVFVGDDIVFNKTGEGMVYAGMQIGIKSCVPKGYEPLLTRYSVLLNKADAMGQGSGITRDNSIKNMYYCMDKASELRDKTVRHALINAKVDIDGAFESVEAVCRGAM